jgi:hypothetical protein
MAAYHAEVTAAYIRGITFCEFRILADDPAWKWPQ